VAVAANCWLVPSAIDGFAGVTDIESSAAGVTVTTVVPLIDPEVAVMVAAPKLDVLTNPVGDTSTVAVNDELHIVVLVRSCVVPSL
jgi:hypothetical protein